MSVVASNQVGPTYCGVCQSRRNNNYRNPGDPALDRFNLNISVVFFVAYITFVVYI